MAAERLAMEIKQHLSTIADSEDWEIKAQICLNVHRLLERYKADRIIDDEGDIRAFMCGFTKASKAPLFDIIDIGGSKKNIVRKMIGPYL